LSTRRKSFVTHEGTNYRTATHAQHGGGADRRHGGARPGPERGPDGVPDARTRSRTYPLRPLGEKAMDELMRPTTGGLRHNRQTLRILGDARGTLPGLPGAESHLGGGARDREAPAGQRRPTREIRARGAADARGADRRSWFDEPSRTTTRHRRWPLLGHVHGGADPQCDDLPPATNAALAAGLRSERLIRTPGRADISQQVHAGPARARWVD